jgi:hypothetical protein
MSTQYRLVQSGKTASGGCSAGKVRQEPVAPRIYLFYLFITTSSFIFFTRKGLKKRAVLVFVLLC